MLKYQNRERVALLRFSGINGASHLKSKQEIWMKIWLISLEIVDGDYLERHDGWMNCNFDYALNVSAGKN